MTDSRAFGYIFGSPDCGHRFFGIKTDKAASQVVLAMRDLFQCVFELKKKEIELAKQHIQNRITAHEHQQVKNSILDHKKISSSFTSDPSKPVSKAEKSPEATTANLVDLEQELSSIQRGITQMERITPNEEGPVKNILNDDPFGDSFTSFSSTPFNILPPPVSSKRNQQKPSDEAIVEFVSLAAKSSTPPIPPFPSTQQSNDSWYHNSGTSSSVFDEAGPSNNLKEDNTRRSFDDSNEAYYITGSKTEIIDAFTDLDPLGTGKSKPYVDKKYFFQDLKNPPKKVLKDLSDQESIFDARFSPHKRTIFEVQNESKLSLDVGLSGGVNFDNTKSVDPFEDEDFSRIDIDEFKTNLSTSPKNSIILPDTKISLSNDEKFKQDDKNRDFYNASMQMDLAPESFNLHSSSDPKRLGDRQGSESLCRNVFSVDSFSRKLQKPNLFGQRNVKRDSNGINMRRLQESDSMSENEPELPPRPEIGSHEPPPLPPKNHRDVFIEQNDLKNNFTRSQTNNNENESRYDYSSRFKSQSTDSPPLPLPSRKINRTDVSYSSTSRPLKKPNEEEDYLTPNPNVDIPTLLPPPQKKDSTKQRLTRKSDTDPKNLDAATPPVSVKSFYEPPFSNAPVLTDITLSQLLTLGIDDLAQKLNVPTQKLSTMTIVELTKYLSEFIDKKKQFNLTPSAMETSASNSPVFKVSFDESTDATFVAKFDDSFGEPESEDNSFVANFEHFNQAPPLIIPADRYAVFREIMDKEIEHVQHETQHQESTESNNSNSLEETVDISYENSLEFERNFSPAMEKPVIQRPAVQKLKIDTKITEAIAGAKDRYAALRDIILVEDLFDKTDMPPLASISDSNLSDDHDDVEQVFETGEVTNSSTANVPTCSISWEDAENVQAESSKNTFEDQKVLQILSTSNKEDFEIDEYMKKTISELSLDQRLSPNTQNKSVDLRSPSLITENEIQCVTKTPTPNYLEKGCDFFTEKLSENYVSNEQNETPLKKIDESKAMKVHKTDYEENNEQTRGERNSVLFQRMTHFDYFIIEKTITPVKHVQAESVESWAVFEPSEISNTGRQEKSPTPTNVKSVSKERYPDKESPYSSDGKKEKDYRRRWPQPPNTSSSSRDVSPWDEDTPNVQRRYRPHHHDTHHHLTDRYARPLPQRRRINSCDEEYDDEYERRPTSSRVRTTKGQVYRSKEVLDSENSNWHYPTGHWSDEDEDERTERKRPFDRSELRNSYGPPSYDKKNLKGFSYERKDYRTNDKRSKFYRTSRNDYEYDPYDMQLAVRGKAYKKDFEGYEENFERGTRESRSAKDYFYDRDRKSFDSNESYDSGRKHRIGSGEICGSYEGSRYDYRDCDRHVNRSLRRNQRTRAGPDDDDTEEDIPRKVSGETGSLQRSALASQRSKHIQLDDEVWGMGPGGKQWKRPSSASAGEKMSGSGCLSGSDSEKDKRFRRKQKFSKGKEIELRSNYATIRYPPNQRKEYYDFEDDAVEFEPNESSPRNISPRSLNPDADFAPRRKHGLPNTKMNTTPRSETRSFSEYSKPTSSRYPEDEEFEARKTQSRGQTFKRSNSRELHLNEKEFYPGVTSSGNDEEILPKNQSRRKDFSIEKQQHSISQQDSKKPSFGGFDSDFISSPKHQEHLKGELKNKFSFEKEFSPSMPRNVSNQQKLRFSENVSVSKFDAESSSQQMFEDDFLEWTPAQDAPALVHSNLKKLHGSNLKTNTTSNRLESIKNSDSVNIFSRTNDEDPFENDDFFNDESKETLKINWNEDNFANFDDNKNI